MHSLKKKTKINNLTFNLKVEKFKKKSFRKKEEQTKHKQSKQMEGIMKTRVAIMKNNFKKQDQQNQKLVFEKMKKKTDKSVA